MVKPKKSPTQVTVRPKASQRKGRNDEVQRTARVPTQERSRLRYQQIIAATEVLLETCDIEDLSLYDIARQADIAPASVHYLFSTVAAIHIELNRIYNISLTEAILTHQRKEINTRNPSWQMWMRSTMARAVHHLNSKRPMAEIMLGPALHRKSSKASQAMNVHFSSAGLAMMREVFAMPDIPDLERYFYYSIDIVEAIWSSSYIETGRISEEAFEEAARAGIAYLRCFLPETLHLKRG